ncbi:sulfite exporter TauE/SafE family protein [Rhodococcus sp. HNM0569]|uniref:TSUP family transporter n=1 Tax=Rhodococcus sp. HNM0569 TaxID=2716340 RepID=UPI00146CDC99|nr:sulfite exporter TauE/SafE family protein [Rhodococcus sp. HNM0569]
MLALTVVLAMLVGVSLGLLGGGGSILTIPLLAYVAGMAVDDAIATSLLVVGVTSVVGAVSHARAGRVRWRTGLLFGLAGTIGALAGGLVSRVVPDTVLLLAFAVMMIATAVGMLRGRRTATRRSVPSTATILLLGVAVGLITGLVGAGGGFLVVPALALLGGLPMPVAVGTSLVVIAMNTFAGFAGHLSAVSIDWPLAGAVTAAAVAGALVGGRLTARVDSDALRKGFGWFVLAMASVVLAQELSPAVGIAAAVLVAVAAAMSWNCSRRPHCLVRRWAVRLRVPAHA